MSSVKINKKRFKISNSNYGKMIVAEYNFLKELNISEVPENICINTRIADSELELILKKINNDTVQIDLHEHFRRKYWMLKLGVTPFMEIKKRIIEQISNNGFNINIITFDTNNDDDYNSLGYTIKIKEENMCEVFQVLDEVLFMINIEVNEILDSFNNYINNTIKQLAI